MNVKRFEESLEKLRKLRVELIRDRVATHRNTDIQVRLTRRIAEANLLIEEFQRQLEDEKVAEPA